MKILNKYNINELSKALYKTNVMASGDSESFLKLSKKLILAYQNDYGYEKRIGLLSTELISTYGLTVTRKEVEDIAELVDQWYNN